MNDSAKRAIVGEAIILAAWLAIMFVCKSIWMNPLTFALSLAFGVLAFAVSSILVILAVILLIARNVLEHKGKGEKGDVR